MCNGCDNDYKTFFNHSSCGKVVPRVVLVDSEPTPIDEIRTGCYRELFHPQSLITGKEDAASNFVLGHQQIGREMIELTMDRIRKHAEDCDSLQGFIVYRAIGGGTGSGFGNLIFEYLNNDYKKLTCIDFNVFPSPRISPVIVEPYNAVLSIHTSFDFINCGLLLDNEALYEICERNLNVPSPNYTNINRIIAQAISGITSSLRFPGSININLLEFQTNLVPFPRVHFPIITYTPIVTCPNAINENLSTSQITTQAFEPANQLVKCDIRKGHYMSCVLMYRGDVSPMDINLTINNLKNKNFLKFVNWSPTGFKIGINSQPPTTVPGGDMAAVNRALVMLSNNSAIKNVWKKLYHKFTMLYTKKAFFHHFIIDHFEEDDLKEAKENLKALICDYIEIDRSECQCPDQQIHPFCK